MGDTEAGERGPECKRKHLTVSGSTAWGVGSGFEEGQRPKKADGRIKKRKNISPGNVGGRVRGGSRFK
jgi:hypothetical protein